jgi:arabinogalactan endo-1,4-beta-galactosidase
MIMETAINFNSHTASGRVGQLTNNGPYGDKDTSSPALQRDFYVELFNEMQGVEDGMCVGSQYWDPIMVYAGGNTGWAYSEITDQHVGNVIDNTTIFDFDGRALPVIHAYRLNKRK